MPTLQTIVQPWLLFVADDPALRAVQGGMLLAGAVLVFLVFWATRDILLRTKSFWYMFASILLVAAFPLIGFLFYLLIRPTRTLRERELEDLLRAIHAHLVPEQKTEKKSASKGKKEKDAIAEAIPA